MKLVAVLLFLGFAFSTHAQEVNYNGTTYKIKGKTILQEKADITATLSAEDQSGIWDAFNKQKALDKERLEAEKTLKKAEKEKQKAEKKQKQAEKELKAKQKAQSKFNKANDDYNKASKKFEKLKERGKLSPNDEEKWLKKIDNLNKDIEKTRKKL